MARRELAKLHLKKGQSGTRAEEIENTQSIRFWSGFISVVFAVIALLHNITTVPAGHVGVVDFFGHVSDNTLKPGIRLANPMAHVVVLSVKTQELKEVMDVPVQR